MSNVPFSRPASKSTPAGARRRRRRAVGMHLTHSTGPLLHSQIIESLFGSYGKFEEQVAEEKAGQFTQAIAGPMDLSTVEGEDPPGRKCQAERSDVDFCVDEMIFQDCVNCIAGVVQAGVRKTNCSSAHDYYCGPEGTAATCAVEGQCGQECKDKLNALVSCSLGVDGCEGCDADL